HAVLRIRAKSVFTVANAIDCRLRAMNGAMAARSTGLNRQKPRHGGQGLDAGCECVLGRAADQPFTLAPVSLLAVTVPG
ncbi:hypothetical protein, partial [Enterococcus faecalis]|uniref:hypothetical protein n=1 Tax=Enterococcus faecalis TaxID=1351 RepID=UPI00403F3BD2